jgi:hypothetical protein
MSQTFEQRLRFGDLGHFGGRRKTFERCREEAGTSFQVREDSRD